MAEPDPIPAPPPVEAPDAALPTEPATAGAGGAEPPPPAPGTRRADRWAHRRGEPRVFAFLWTLFLLAVTVLCFASVGLGGPVTLDIYRPAARVLLVTTGLGVTVLWPMTRLAQAMPARRAVPGAVLKDLAVVLFPVQAVLWPQVWLAAWPRGVVAMTDGVLAAWGLLTAGWLGLAMRSLARREAGGAPSGARAAWMAGGLALVLAAPAAMALGGGGPAALAMLSPVTAVFELTRDRAWTGPWGGVGPAHVWTTAAVGLVGAALVAGSARRGRAGPG